MKYILAHDLGTSGNKATLFSDEGKMITSEVFRYDCHYFNTNWAEQDPEDFWKAICVTSRNLIDKARIDPGDIAAVSFSGQMMGCLCVDKQGNPLRPSIIWADQRAQAQAAALGEQISLRDFYHIAGHRNSASYGLQKLMWVRDNEPEVYRGLRNAAKGGAPWRHAHIDDKNQIAREPVFQAERVPVRADRTRLPRRKRGHQHLREGLNGYVLMRRVPVLFCAEN